MYKRGAALFLSITIEFISYDCINVSLSQEPIKRYLTVVGSIIINFDANKYIFLTDRFKLGKKVLKKEKIVEGLKKNGPKSK